jgi:hypothetical protein
LQCHRLYGIKIPLANARSDAKLDRSILTYKTRILITGISSPLIRLFNDAVTPKHLFSPRTSQKETSGMVLAFKLIMSVKIIAPANQKFVFVIA